ncbi:MAG: GNAT family N-acetyltransferase [Alicyclobacillus sp.]|nr:GNAT family N-acetyltransferase [Alicyclobacillus sp.]
MIGEGAFRVLVDDEHPMQYVGFVTAGQVNPVYLHDTSAMECGTYLLPEWRGRGLNRVVKQLWLRWIFHNYNPEYAVFVIPLDNTLAQRAFAKLPWTYSQTRSNPASPFHKYLRRREWELGKPCELYSISREDWLQR